MIPVCSLVMCLGKFIEKTSLYFGKSILQGGVRFVECAGVFLLGYTYIRIIRLVIVYNHGNSVLVVSTKFDFFREKGVTFYQNSHLYNKEILIK